MPVQPTPAPLPNLLDVDDLAKWLGCSLSHAYVVARQLPDYCKVPGIGRCVRIREDGLQRYLQTAKT